MWRQGRISKIIFRVAKGWHGVSQSVVGVPSLATRGHSLCRLVDHGHSNSSSCFEEWMLADLRQQRMQMGGLAQTFWTLAVGAQQNF